MADEVDELENKVRGRDGVECSESHEKEAAEDGDSIKVHFVDKACGAHAREAGHGEAGHDIASSAFKFNGSVGSRDGV